MYTSSLLLVCLWAYLVDVGAANLVSLIDNDEGRMRSNQLRALEDNVETDNRDYLVKALIDKTMEVYELKNSEWKDNIEKKLNQKIARIEEKQESSGSEVYTRWGSLTCPNQTAEIIYSGYAAGSNYGNSGGSAAPVCLVPDPTNEKYKQAVPRTFIYGTEYETDTPGEHNHDVPCAVCRTKGHSTVYMSPGKPTCEHGWTIEYDGYLMGGSYAHPGNADFVCVDKKRNTLPGGHKNDNGQLFYFVSPSCGSLSCPPYIAGSKICITCAVCSK